MKQIGGFLIYLALIPLIMLASCTDEEMIQGVTASASPKVLNISANYITANSEGSSTKLNLVASDDVSWTFTDIPDWISLSPISGKGTASVVVLIRKNNSTLSRSHTLILMNTDAGWKANILLKITQSGMTDGGDDPDDPDNPDNPDNPQTYQAVDLGLSVLWATFNVGASVPEGYGNYYAWGETEPKTLYDWSNYKWCDGEATALTKYCLYPEDGYNGYVDDKVVLDEEDDVAHVKWGERWRMASYEEFQELINMCDWAPTTENGVKGCRVTSLVQGYEGRSIFIPYAGYIDSVDVSGAGEEGIYWANSILTNYYSYFAEMFYMPSITLGYIDFRCIGQSVRPVAPSDTWKGITSLSLNKTTVNMYKDEVVKVKCSLWSGNEDYSFMFAANWSSSDNNVARVDKQGVIVGVSVGEAVITAEYNGLTAYCYVTVKEYEPVTEYVDLGLSVNWATCNLGAQLPEESGYFYSWGETVPKEVYNWSSYSMCSGSNETLTKYCNDSSHGLDGYSDELTVLESDDDAAYLLLGGDWRMPSMDEFNELLTNCSWELIERNGVSGYEVTSNISGYTDRSIFIPISGYRSGSYLYEDEMAYWSNQLYENNPAGAWSMDYLSNNGGVMGYNRCIGAVIRPVCPSTTWTPIVPEMVDLGLSVKWASFNVGASKPEEYGDYFAWGETEIHYKPGYAQSTSPVWMNGKEEGYSWSNYKYCNGEFRSLTKYCNNSEYSNNGYADNKLKLDLNDDVAHVKWGGNWRIPTKAEFRELLSFCTWTSTTVNGVNGYLVTSNMPGYEYNSIFLPLAGYRDGTNLYNLNSYGSYMSSTLFRGYPSQPFLMCSLLGESMTVNDRNYGQSVRPVCVSEEWKGITNMYFSDEVVELYEYGAYDMVLKMYSGTTYYDCMIDEVTWRSSNPDVATVDCNGRVTAVSEGYTEIIATYRDLEASCPVYVYEYAYNTTGYEESRGYVDLGLSVKWATCNIGAEYMTDYGDYFAWGEVEPYYAPGTAHAPVWKEGKSGGYRWSNYLYCLGDEVSMIKYCGDSGSGYNGFTDDKTTLDLSDDVAHIEWGGNWRMPTVNEINELLDYCIWNWVNIDGVYGYMVSSSNKWGPKGNCIFLPAAGAYYNEGPSPTSENIEGYYWSSSLYQYTSRLASSMTFSGNMYYAPLRNRYVGCTVRPVCP